MRIESFYHLRVALLFAAALFIGLLTASCSTAPVPIPTIVPEIGIRGSDPVESVGLSHGQILAVDLVNSTIGYSWKVGAINRSVLEPIDDSSLTPSLKHSGANGRTIMRFKAVGEGECELNLIYGRTFEKDEPLTRTFSVKVTVR